VPGVYAGGALDLSLSARRIAMVKEKGQGTILQVYASGIRPSELLLVSSLPTCWWG